MEDPTIQAELRQLDSLMHTMAAAKGVPLAKVVRNAARDFTRGALKATPQADKGIESDCWQFKPDSKHPANHNGGNAQYWLSKRKQWEDKHRGPLKWPITHKISSGYAKASWRGVMQLLGVPSAGRYPSAQGEGSVASHAYDTTEIPWFIIRNTLSYMNKLDARSGLVMAGLQNAEAKIINSLSQMQAQLFRQQGAITVAD